jgi:hypothetical protein
MRSLYNSISSGLGVDAVASSRTKYASSWVPVCAIDTEQFLFRFTYSATRAQTRSNSDLLGVVCFACKPASQWMESHKDCFQQNLRTINRLQRHI